MNKTLALDIATIAWRLALIALPFAVAAGLASWSWTVAAITWPATLALLGAGFVALLWGAQREQRRGDAAREAGEVEQVSGGAV